jgi:hypothetical protein
MLDTPLPICTEEVKSQAVPLLIDFFNQTRPQHNPLCGINLAFENGELNPLPVILAGLGDASQAPMSSRRYGLNVIADEHEHANHFQIIGG